MPTFAEEDQTKNQIEFVFYTIPIILLIAIGFGVLIQEGIVQNVGKLIIYILYSGYNFVFIAFAAVTIFVRQAKNYVFAYLHNFENSWLQNNGLFKLKKGTFFHTVHSNVILTFIFYLLLFLPAFFLAFAVPRQLAIQFFPVAPQAVFPIKELGFRIFYQVFPAFSGETGLLAIINSIGSSLIILLFAQFGKEAKPIGYWVSLFVVGFLLSGFGWLQIHGIVAAGKEFNMISHFIFGITQGLLMVATGSIAPALAIHFLNLLFYAFNEIIGGVEFLRTGLPLAAFLVIASLITAVTIFTNQSRKKRK